MMETEISASPKAMAFASITATLELLSWDERRAVLNAIVAFFSPEYDPPPKPKDAAR